MKINMNTMSRTIALSRRNYSVNTLPRKKENLKICQEDDDNQIDGKKSYVKRKDFNYKSRYIDSIKF